MGWEYIYIHQVDFGVSFLTACNKFPQQNNSVKAHLEIKNVKEMFMSMLEEVFSQVMCRLPLARDTYETLSKLSPVISLNKISRPMFSELSFIYHAGNNIRKTEEQYRQMPFVDWKGGTPFDP